MAAEDDWQGVENDISDPEELRVIYQALDSFFRYAKVAHFNCTHLRRQSFYALPQAHWKLLASPPFNYLNTLERVDEAIDTNAELARAIAEAGIASFHMQESRTSFDGIAKANDIDKARSTLRQFYRDWSAEGRPEREASYGPVKQYLQHMERVRIQEWFGPSPPSSLPSLPPLKVLVPGAGLGRLVFDLCDLGYEVEGNEISYHQLLASSYVLNRAPAARQHTIYPWVQSFSNHASRANQFRSYAVPDVHPATQLATPTKAGGSMSMSAADFLCLYEQEAQRERFDAVASVFFLDTAPNLIRYIEAIRNCLRPGGVLINVGPLLWHFEDNAPGNHGRDDDGDGEHDPNASSGIADPGSFELTDDEVIALVERLGFEMVRKNPMPIEAPYIQDRESMLRTVYRASSWVAKKKIGWVSDV
ncbi:hypothetical protein MCOR27_003939 [Pyricularia oryzae]|uniref:carnosine N-methyltransferase n=3 Tax=Pyricularia TaxID=48558 RepID=A0ABQ8NH76_PYRGI|nr:hypothetical protein MCOR01_005971 [Pyricularia oryzae]KAI6295689.1 hypothetical protein MCOR33_007483 [Pyricularia grisea]KAH9435213.1 hypothetical protein MCOR02_004164 [Pyricularia oryzae]KAI6258763.1 hypothetical protein MCOR19_004862 [Pyricularia oryzae]KAI6282017.1 hypothetical protein MCOR27_003939 [Pyricularia oryzae]